MWRYLIVNSLWFSILFSVHFFGSARDRLIMLGSILLMAAVLGVRGIMEPFAWMQYLVFSLVAFTGSASFKQWMFAQLKALEEEIHLSSKNLERAQEELSQKTRRTEVLAHRADEIAGLFDRIKEMSKSLDHFEALLTFGEALAGYFEFGSVKLAMLEARDSEAVRPVEFYELRAADLRGLPDRGSLLKDRSKAFGEVYPFDQKCFEEVFRTRKPARLTDPAQHLFVLVHPLLVRKRLFGVLTLTGVHEAEAPLLKVLIERFVSEMQRVKLYEEVEQLATTDGLTGVFVRRHFLERLESEWDRARRFGFKLSFLMVDVDHFKDFNDRYGHLVGDAVLAQTAQTIKKSVREVDLVGRYGGEEFGVLLVETDESGAMLVAERIRKAVEEREFRAYDENLKVAVSIGCASLSSETQNIRRMIDLADQAMYQAKRLGRNQVCLAQNRS